jgi:putative transposase
MLKSLLLFFQKSFTTKTQLILENIFLAKQLEIYQRADPKLNINRTDRIFFNLMKDLLSNWKERIFIVKPETIIKWHRTAFKFYWRWKSKPKGGRPKVSREVINLIR